MLQLKSIRKAYTTGSLTQVALDKVTLNLRDSEFVAVLGPSGSGKTTLLNIIGGLDRYDTGDLVIDGVSTTRYKDRDWDSYRNHAVGFVFQNYNLIPHQSVLANVELALTISGIPKAERRRRALAALDQVGLGDQAHKRPNQMSGGQMQRVAIARALVNDPSVLLADEPTGALDSTTSTGVMDLLKQVAQDRLVIMVTHNAELAQRYATRLVKLRDGAITEDTDPFDLDDAAHPTPQHKNMGKASMSFVTALSLSFKNLLTKKTRTMLTSFAGSIGIIGIALILSLSSGMQAYIQSIQEDTLSTYPIEITAEALDISGMMTAMMADNTTDRTGRDPDTVYSNNIITDLMESMSGQLDSNDLAQFKKFLESPDGQAIADLSNTIQYGYDLDLQIYGADTTDGVLKVNPTEIFTEVLGVGSSGSQGGATGPGGVGVQMSSSGLPGASSNPMAVVRSDIWSEMLGNEELLRKQYDVLAGSWPQTYDEVVIVLDENNELSDVALYSLGILEQDHLAKMMEQIQNGETVEPSGIATLSYQDLLDLRFKLVLNTDVYAKEGSVWVDQSDSQVFMKPVVTNALEVKVVGVLRPNAEITAASISGTVAYTQALNQYVMEQIAASAIVHEQTADPSVNVLTGAPFDIDAFTEDITMDDVAAYLAALPAAEQDRIGAMLQTLSEEETLAMFADLMKDSADQGATYEDNLAAFGLVDPDEPSAINIYPKDFEAKDSILALIEDYNAAQEAAGHEEYTISYSDLMAIMMASVTSIMDIITYVLIAFVAISLVVSSIMIGIITYISVLERTKEIGILRAIGASKRDISRVFNAETVIEGLVAGGLGIGLTLILNIPINMVIKSLTEISGVAALPAAGAGSLILLSVLLTVIAGLLPARIAARKDPVEALRTE